MGNTFLLNWNLFAAKNNATIIGEIHRPYRRGVQRHANHTQTSWVSAIPPDFRLTNRAECHRALTSILTDQWDPNPNPTWVESIRREVEINISGTWYVVT